MKGIPKLHSILVDHGEDLAITTQKALARTFFVVCVTGGLLLSEPEALVISLHCEIF